MEERCKLLCLFSAVALLARLPCLTGRHWAPPPQGKKQKKGKADVAAAPSFRRWRNEELAAFEAALLRMGPGRAQDVKREVWGRRRAGCLRASVCCARRRLLCPSLRPGPPSAALFPSTPLPHCLPAVPCALPALCARRRTCWSGLWRSVLSWRQACCAR